VTQKTSTSKKSGKKLASSGVTKDAPVSSAETVTGAMTEAFLNAKTPEQMRELGKQFMMNIMSNIGRLDQRLAFIDRHNQALVSDINDQIDYFNQCLSILFSAVHQEVPKRMPRLLDAKAELTKGPKEGDECDMQAAYFKKKHPTFGNIQVILGMDNKAKTYGLNGIHPILGRALSEAFENLRTAKQLVDGQFYYVRWTLFHSRPISDDSTKVEQSTESVNDDNVQGS
jgi:hypothetical protein